MFLDYTIQNDNLTEANIPAFTAVWDQGLIRFALTFDGYHYTVNYSGDVPMSRLATFARPIIQGFAETGCLPTSLSLGDLRACLFWEQRRDHHADKREIVGIQSNYIHALLKAIKEKVRARELTFGGQ